MLTVRERLFQEKNINRTKPYVRVQNSRVIESHQIGQGGNNKATIIRFSLDPAMQIMNGAVYIKQQLVRNKEIKKIQLNKDISKQFRHSFASSLQSVYEAMRQQQDIYVSMPAKIQNIEGQRQIEIQMSSNAFPFKKETNKSPVINILFNLASLKSISRSIFNKYIIEDQKDYSYLEEIIDKQLPYINEGETRYLVKQYLRMVVYKVQSKKKKTMRQQLEKTMDSESSGISNSTIAEITEKLDDYLSDLCGMLMHHMMVYNFVMICYEFQHLRPYDIREELLMQFEDSSDNPKDSSKRTRLFLLTLRQPDFLTNLLESTLSTQKQTQSYQKKTSQIAMLTIQNLNQIFHLSKQQHLRSALQNPDSKPRANLLKRVQRKI